MGDDSGNVGGSDSWEQGLHGVAKGRGGLRGSVTSVLFAGPVPRKLNGDVSSQWG